MYAINGQTKGRNYNNFERNLAMMVMYLPVKFEFDWTNHFRVRVRKRKCWRTNERTELHQFWKEPSYDGDLSPCQVWIRFAQHFRVRVRKQKCWRTDKQTELHQFQKEPSYDGDLSPCQVWIRLDTAFFELESRNRNVDGQTKNRRNYTNFERNLAVMVIYVPVKFEFDWTKHFWLKNFELESGNENVDGQTDVGHISLIINWHYHYWHPRTWTTGLEIHYSVVCKSNVSSQQLSIFTFGWNRKTFLYLTHSTSTFLRRKGCVCVCVWGGGGGSEPAKFSC